MCCMSSLSLCLGLASKAKATIPQAIPSVFFLCCFVKEVPRKLGVSAGVIQMGCLNRKTTFG